MKFTLVKPTTADYIRAYLKATTFEVGRERTIRVLWRIMTAKKLSTGYPPTIHRLSTASKSL